ncbi:kinase-like protein [Ascobolus immersus RN42]|uniref:Kinase-like protein n=1 Tax=Ascobolus immersus RN42 TaxID=1160509 RepID=A0A3N4HZA7_ASCIM|nr:kinase-like protein [Ascobolus immersus RN42]
MTASMTTMTSLLEKNDVIEPFQDNAIIHGDITEHRRGENRPERWIRISSAKFVDGAFGHIHLEKLENPKNEKKTTLRVVKVIPEQQAKDNETLFFREVKAMATCRRREYREYFVQMRCWFVANGAYHIAMEYCPHGDLDEFCRKGPLPEQYARTVVKQVLQGLRFFHGQGFAHRDLKPKNILVYEIPTDSTELKVKIADFGISKRARPDDNTKYSSVCGTLGFLAPEVLEKKATYNESVDIWSVGCLQYWLLTKAEDTIFFRGFQEDSNDDGGTIVLRNLQARNVSSNAIAFLLRTLQREPRDRPTADQALRLSWMVREVINYGSDDDSDSDTSTVIISDSRLPTSPISPSSITDSGPCLSSVLFICLSLISL